MNRLYHTKASLALTNLQLRAGEITIEAAIDRVDGLRFAWRGDGLEVQILQNLGQLKIRNRQFLSGLKDMENAANLARQLMNDPEDIYAEMADTLRDIFINGASKDMEPLEAVSVYSAYGMLIPPGEEKTLAGLNYADFLIGMDLLKKAAEVLQAGLSTSSVPAERVPEVGKKLAVVYLLDRQPEQALKALKTTEVQDMDAAMQTERALLSARALSLLGKTDQAIAALQDTTGNDARRLRVDILWRAQRWDDVGQVLRGMLPAPETALTQQTARLVLNTAVAYKLAGDTAALADLQRQYHAAMQGTGLESGFGVITRDGGLDRLSDRKTLLGIAGEVDMFKEFMDAYKIVKRSGG